MMVRPSDAYHLFQSLAQDSNLNWPLAAIYATQFSNLVQVAPLTTELIPYRGRKIDPAKQAR